MVTKSYPGKKTSIKKNKNGVFSCHVEKCDPIVTTQCGPIAKQSMRYPASSRADYPEGFMVGPYYAFFMGWFEDRSTAPSVVTGEWVAWKHPSFDQDILPAYLVSAVNGRSLGSYELGDRFDLRPPNGRDYFKVSYLEDALSQNMLRSEKEKSRKNLVSMIENYFSHGTPIPKASVVRTVSVEGDKA